jgi:hypothetical protein
VRSIQESALFVFVNALLIKNGALGRLKQRKQCERGDAQGLAIAFLVRHSSALGRFHWRS